MRARRKGAKLANTILEVPSGDYFMAFRLKLNEPIQKGMRRIGLEQIERAETLLAEAGDPETAIHETRKALKRIRALLQLAREGLGEAAFRTENARYRTISGLLAPSRDSDVLFATVTKLEGSVGPVTSTALAALKKVIVEERERNETARDERVREAQLKLVTAKKRFRRLTLKPATFDTIEAGLVRAYRKAKHAFTAAYAAGGEEVFHEWRKTVQLHWRHMALVSNAWPDLFKARVEGARALSQILGDEHDLDVLAAFARSLPPDRLSPLHVREIEQRTAERQKHLRMLAEPRGHQLFAEGARGYGRRVAVMWSAAEQIAQSSEEETEAAPARREPSPQAATSHP